MPTHCFEGTASVGREHMCMWIVHLRDYLVVNAISPFFSLSTHDSSKVRSLHGWFHTVIPGLKEANGEPRSAHKQWLQSHSTKHCFNLDASETDQHPLKMMMEVSGSSVTEAGNKGILQQHPRSCLDFPGVQTLNGFEWFCWVGFSVSEHWQNLWPFEQSLIMSSKTLKPANTISVSQDTQEETL